MSDLIDPEAVAARLGITSRSVRNLLDRGVLRGSKIGRVWRVRPEDVDALIAATSNQPANVIQLTDKKAAR